MYIHIDIYTYIHPYSPCLPPVNSSAGLGSSARVMDWQIRVGAEIVSLMLALTILDMEVSQNYGYHFGGA